MMGFSGCWQADELNASELLGGHGRHTENLESRTMSLESDVATMKGLAEEHKSPLMNIQWKLEDQENRQGKNNL
ncbi:hypothetical protein NDU88_004770 [Pleurodeles waltl]|uniref:Uncharacterized protein n=1 Tax=Pleurodeles waltl TaxID=8319 RepID=A0AAV7L177_PLEWA|nr:hypothetical protein NDU88_004770 [Pleurodeles waltl]